jgi:hypothetical protein
MFHAITLKGRKYNNKFNSLGELLNETTFLLSFKGFFKFINGGTERERGRG